MRRAPAHVQEGTAGLYVSFHAGPRPARPIGGVLHRRTDQLQRAVPADATDLVFDEHRPYLGCIAPQRFRRDARFLPQGDGRDRLDAALRRRYRGALAERRAQRDDRERRARLLQPRRRRGRFYQQPPIMLSLQRRDDGRTGVEIKVAPFALPQISRPMRDGRPAASRNRPSFGSTGSSNSVRREMKVAVMADLPVVLAFYRRELAARSWTEERSGAVVTGDDVTLNFSSAGADRNAPARPQIRSHHRQPRHADEGSGAGRARQGEEGSRRQVHERRRAMAKQVIAADEARRTAQAAIFRMRRCRRWPTARRRCRCRRTRRTSNSTAPTAGSNSTPPPA